MKPTPPHPESVTTNLSRRQTPNLSKNPVDLSQAAIAVFISLMTFSSSPSKDLIHLAPGCPLSGEDRQVSPQAQVSTFNNRVLNPTFCQIRSKAKPHVPCSGKWGSSFLYPGPSCFVPPESQRGLRAKNYGRRITRLQDKIKKIRGVWSNILLR
jgi:hypothetical protein